MTTGLDEPRLDAWERRTGWPLTVAAVAFLGAYAWPILDPSISSRLARTLATITLVLWAVFTASFASWFLDRIAELTAAERASRG